MIGGKAPERITTQKTSVDGYFRDGVVIEAPSGVPAAVAAAAAAL